MGQGATVALPIWAKFMQKVYADHSLGYSTEERFAIPDNFSPCATVRSDSLENESINAVFQ